MKRSPLRRKTPLKRTPFVVRRKKAQGVPKDIYAQVVLRDQGCRASLLAPDVRCFGRLDPHHVLRKSQGGPDTLDNLVLLCRAHHDHVHRNPAWSKSVGLLRAR